MSDYVNADALLAFSRAKARTASARGEAARAKLGVRESSGGVRPLTSVEDLTRGLTAEQIERDTATMRNVLRVWKATGKRGARSRIHLPSGRIYHAPEIGAGVTNRELAVPRTPKNQRPKRRRQG